MSERPVPSDVLRRLPARLAALPILAYRYGISPVIGPRCRFHPSCSEYGLQALSRFGLARGGWLTLARVCRCHPWNPGGFDPLPDADGSSADPVSASSAARATPHDGDVRAPSPFRS